MLEGHDFPQRYGEQEIKATDAIFGKEGRDQLCRLSGYYSLNLFDLNWIILKIPGVVQ